MPANRPAHLIRIADGMIGGPRHAPRSARPPTRRREPTVRPARVRRALESRRWLISVANIVAASLFVVGCIGFYVPARLVASVTAFLAGSVLFLFSAVAGAVLEHARRS